MQKHEAQGGDEAKITTDVEVRRCEMIDLVRSDAFAMSFQSIKQYREALLRLAQERTWRAAATDRSGKRGEV